MTYYTYNFIQNKSLKWQNNIIRSRLYHIGIQLMYRLTLNGTKFIILSTITMGRNSFAVGY